MPNTDAYYRPGGIFGGGGIKPGIFTNHFTTPSAVRPRIWDTNVGTDGTFTDFQRPKWESQALIPAGNPWIASAEPRSDARDWTSDSRTSMGLFEGIRQSSRGLCPNESRRSRQRLPSLFWKAKPFTEGAPHEASDYR
jgi:hypothetical protein